MADKILLGQTAKDPITGVEGIVYSRTEYLTGCARIGIQQKQQKDGKVPDLWGVDEPIAIVTKETIVGQEAAKKTRKRGGPRNLPPERR